MLLVVNNRHNKVNPDPDDLDSALIPYSIMSKTFFFT